MAAKTLPDLDLNPSDPASNAMNAPPFTLLVALVWQCRGWLLAAVGRADF